MGWERKTKCLNIDERDIPSSKTASGEPSRTVATSEEDKLNAMLADTAPKRELRGLYNDREELKKENKQLTIENKNLQEKMMDFVRLQRHELDTAFNNIFSAPFIIIGGLIAANENFIFPFFAPYNQYVGVIIIVIAIVLGNLKPSVMDLILRKKRKGGG
ncbi:MAG: hypothetical protein LBO66_11755 [Deltaproteobacteria bacterium]|nr:hypothetical protein [Deltaproteobacteria bacterium]